jgi:hypothetical protein
VVPKQEVTAPFRKKQTLSHLQEVFLLSGCCVGKTAYLGEILCTENSFVWNLIHSVSKFSEHQLAWYRIATISKPALEELRV